MRFIDSLDIHECSDAIETHDGIPSISTRDCHIHRKCSVIPSARFSQRGSQFVQQKS